MILSALFLAPAPSASLDTSSLTTLELSPEEGVLGWVHGVIVGLEEGGVHSRNSLHETLEAGGDLELLEEAGSDTASGGAGETNLVIDNDGGVDGGADQGLADDVKVSLQGGGGVADRNSPVDQSRELLLQALNDLAQALELLDLNL